MSRLLIIIVTIAGVVSAQGKNLPDPELLHYYLTNTYPEFVVYENFSSRIDLKSITCSVSNTRKGKKPAIETSCTATNWDGTTADSKGSVTSLIFGLMNARSEIDRESEAGTTYVSATNLECLRSECKSADPKDCRKAPITYECAAD